jgi:Uma2 family endonuclease
MATKTLITAEQYLSTPFEYEPELVRGEIVERPLPNKTHSKIQGRLYALLIGLGFCYPALRMRVAQNSFRIPDIAFFDREPDEEVPDSPPLLIVEIVSPDHRYRDLMQKLRDYAGWGVSNIWVVDPEFKTLCVYDGGLIERPHLELPTLGFSISATDLFN